MLTITRNLETNFRLATTFHADPNSESGVRVTDSGGISVIRISCEARKALRRQVEIICEQPYFNSGLLTVNTHRNDDLNFKA